MFYQFYEWNHAALTPFRALADATKIAYQSPANPLTYTAFGRTIAASAEVFERATRRYAKPTFDLPETVIDGIHVPVTEEIVWKQPFCQLLHFKRDKKALARVPSRTGDDPKILMVAPMSGHYATLLRGTVETLLPHADIYITDWTDARKVPISDGTFGLNDYIAYIMEMLHNLGPNTHVMGVCQPSVPVLAAVSLMAKRNDDCAPSSMILMGGPIDTRCNPTAVNQLAEDKGIEWFRENVIMKVPFPHEGAMRSVYPGFLQLTGFMSMNLDRHVTATHDFFDHLVEGDGDSAEKHREFYDEYLAVMDLDAAFYLDTVQTVFIDHALPKGEMRYRGERIEPSRITKTALMTIEGENDDITGRGQTKAAQDLCSNIPADMKLHYEQPKVGHYGVFNGSRFRAQIAPRIIDFLRKHDAVIDSKPKAKAKTADA